MPEKIALQTRTENPNVPAFKEKTCKSLIVVSVVFFIIAIIFLTVGTFPVSVILFSGALSLIGLYIMIVGACIFLLSLAYLLIPSFSPDKN